jgi:hypothetical protein
MIGGRRSEAVEKIYRIGIDIEQARQQWRGSDGDSQPEQDGERADRERMAPEPAYGQSEWRRRRSRPAPFHRPFPSSKMRRSSTT